MAKRIVLDSSIAIKWFLKDEDGTEKADEILVGLLQGTLEVHIPGIFYYEVTGVLTRACARFIDETRTQHRIEKNQALECIRKLFRVSRRMIVHALTEDECVDALDKAVSNSKTAYDMVYLRLAETLACSWCTADEKVLQSWPKESEHFLSHIVLLKDFQLQNN